MNSLFELVFSKAPLRCGLIAGALLLSLHGHVSLAAVDPKAGRFYEDALTRFNKSDMPGAIIQLKNAIQVDPRMLSAQLLLGKALLANAEVAAAEVALMEALNLGVSRTEIVLPLARSIIAQGKQRALFERPEFRLEGLPPNVKFQLLIVRAGAQSDLGKQSDALRSVSEARAINSDSPDSWVAEVPLRIRASQFKEGLSATDRALSLAPNSADAWNQKGAVFHAMGNLAEALRAYSRAIELAPAHLEARIARAGINLDLRRYDDATGDVSMIREHVPDEPRAAYLRAMIAEQKGDGQGAKTALAEVTGFLDPVPLDYIRYRPQLLMLNGLSHFSLGNMDKAKLYLEAIPSGSAYPSAKVLAQIYLAEGRGSKAQSVLEAYLRTHPKDSRAMMLLATAALASGRSYTATKLMEEALAIDDSPAVRTAFGESLLAGGKTEDALAQLEKAFKASPGQSQTGFLLAGIYMRNNQPKKAVSVAESVVKRSPDVAAHHNLLGLAKGAAGDIAGAKSAFERALKLDPGFSQAMLNLARIDIGSRSYESAERRLNELLKLNSHNVDALLASASLADARGDFKAVQRALENARDAEPPKQIGAALRLVEFHVKRGQPALALEAAKFAYSKMPEDFQVLMVYALTRRDTNDADGARAILKIAGKVAHQEPARLVAVALRQLSVADVAGAQYSLEKAISSAPDYLAAQILMVEVDMRQGDRAKAERRARAIVGSNPSRSSGYSMLGDISLAQGQLGQAVEHYRKAHAVEPSRETFLRLFNALSRQGDGRAALSMAEDWLKANPDDSVVRRALADAYARGGRYRQAEKAYSVVVERQPKDVAALNNLANVKMKLEDLPGAVRIAKLALAQAPENVMVIDTLGWALHMSGQTEQALTYLRDARLRNPDNPTIRFHLGAVLAKAGRAKEAREELETALAASQSFDGAEDARRLLPTLK